MRSSPKTSALSQLRPVYRKFVYKYQTWIPCTIIHGVRGVRMGFFSVLHTTEGYFFLR